MNLHDKTPQQLNMMVAENKYPDCIYTSDGDMGVLVTKKPESENADWRLQLEFVGLFNWIGDDALAFRLMVDNGICITAESMSDLDESYWWASEKIIVEECGGIDCGVNSRNKNPNRAIVETFILMNQHKEG